MTNSPDPFERRIAADLGAALDRALRPFDPAAIAHDAARAGPPSVLRIVAASAVVVVIGVLVTIVAVQGLAGARLPFSTRPTPTGLAEAELVVPGAAVRFQAADADGPWADITVTRGPDIAAWGMPAAPQPVATMAEIEVTYRILRTRNAPFAALIDWAAYGEQDGTIAPTAAVDWSFRQPGTTPLPQRFEGPRAGETVAGVVYVALLGDLDATWLGFTPAPIGAATIETEVPWTKVERGWRIAPRVATPSAASPPVETPIQTQTESPSPAVIAEPSPMTEAQVVGIATAAVGRSDLTMVLSVNEGPANKVLPTLPGGYESLDLPSAETRIWLVNLSDGGPSLGASGAWVVIDYLDGTVYGVREWIS